MPAKPLDLAPDDVHSNAPAANLGDLIGCREAGLEYEMEDFVLARGLTLQYLAFFPGLAQNFPGIESAAIVGDRHDDMPGLVRGPEPHHSFALLALDDPLFRRFHTALT